MERRDNEKLEETFQNIKKITGMSNVKQIVERIGNKDKNYNFSVAKVNEKEIKINILQEQIKKLEEDYVRLKNEVSVDSSEITKNTSNINTHNDPEEQDLINREQEINEELSELAAKNENVELTYEKVMENIMIFIKKTDKFPKIDNSSESTRIEKSVNNENEVLKNYTQFLNFMKESVDKSFSKVK